MTSETHVADYDENSVFNRLLAEEKRESKPTKGERLALIFAETKPSIEPIRVQDFLPTY